MSRELKIILPKIYEPLDEPFRYKIMWGGRGSAKSWTVAIKLLLRGLERPLRILCTRELQKSIRQSVHKLLSDQIYAMGLQHFYRIEQQGIFGKNGTEFIFMGTKNNPEEIKSTEGIDICWVEEGHSLTQRSWDIIDPTIRKEGSEIWVTYNTRFKFDTIHKMFVVDEPPPNSWVQLINHSDNQFFPTPLKIQMEHMKKVDYEKYLHIWEGQLKQLADGAIFGKQILEVKKQNRLTFIPIQKNCEVHTYMDLGKKDETAIWFIQAVGKEFHVIDYFQGRLEEIEYYTRFIKGQPYNYGTHYLPHDGKHERLGMERTIQEQFEDGGVRPTEIVPVISDKTTAIQLGREVFPSCWFHLGNDNLPDEQCDGYDAHVPEELNTRAKRMAKGWDALCNYRYKYKDDDDVFQSRPHHDWASNGSDAFMTFAQADKADNDQWGGKLSYNHANMV
jgi:phage terminase large subunit